MEQPDLGDWEKYSSAVHDDGLGGLAPAQDGGGELEDLLDQELFAAEDDDGYQQPPAKKRRKQAGEDVDLNEGEGDDGDRSTEETENWENQQDDEPEEPEPENQGPLPDADLMKAKFDAMTEAQRNRYEEYRRSTLPKARMKKLIEELTGQKSNDKVIIALNAITKLFLGDVVERARITAAYQGHTGALLPCHLRQAYHLLDMEGKVPHRGPAKPLRLG